MIIPRIENQN
jgi:hypothetical protein